MGFIKSKKDPSLRKGIKIIYEKLLKKAKKIIPDKKKISKKIRKARKIFDRLHNIPRFDAFSKNICDFCDLLSDYLDGNYKKLPLSTIIAILAGILYVVLPIDFLADIIPVIGWIDDAMVLGFVIKSEQNDVKEYLDWKQQQLTHEDGSLDTQ